MAVDEDTNWEADRRKDFIRLAILISIALVLGLYHIFTTVLIAKDGVTYIEQAKFLAGDSVGKIRKVPFGYPFLIFLAHKAAVLSGGGTSIYSWILSGQCVTLLCRLLALIPLYFLGKLLVGGKKSFWAVLILLFLPYPAEFGFDVLRDWPHILFLMTGLLFLFVGAEQNKPWMFVAACLAAGAGYTVRPECAQLVIYTVLWLFFRPFISDKHPRLVCVAALFWYQITVPAGMTEADKGFVYAGLGGDIPRAVLILGGLAGKLLMYYFVLPLVMGLYCHFSKKQGARSTEKFFISAFVTVNVAMLFVLYCTHGYISSRHLLPLVTILVFYVPDGLEVMSHWLSTRFSGGRPGSARLWFALFVAVGIIICLPKLVRPLRVEKQSYRDASKWLSENTADGDIIAVPDNRISFYAEREGMLYTDKGNIPEAARYIVAILNDEGEELNFGRTVRERYSTLCDRKECKLVIYEVL